MTGGIIPAALLIAALCLLAPPARAATNDLTSALQRGLFEEEANQNLGTAIQAYLTVANQFDKDRKLAATAIFRLGECYRKQGNTNDAATQYERILREFTDQPTLVNLSRQSLAGMGSAPRIVAAPTVLSGAARQEQNRLLEKEMKAVQAQLDWQQQQVQAGVSSANEVVNTERELLELKRQLGNIDAGQPTSLGSAEADAQAAKTAEAESLSLEAQLAAFKILPKDKVRRELLQSHPNAALHSLVTSIESEEGKLVALEASYRPEHPQVVAKKAQVAALDQQIDAHVEAALKGLELKRDIAASRAKRLQALLAAAASQNKEGATAQAAPVLSNAARQEQKRLLEEEMKLVEKQLESQQKQVQAGIISPDALLANQRDLLKLKRQLAALDAGLPLTTTATETPAPATSTEAEEVKRIQALIKDSPDLINAPDQAGVTLLQSAALKGNLAVVKVLLENGAAVDGLQQPGLTPLAFAAASGHKAAVDLLLSKGAKADAHTENGVTPLHLAARKGHETVAKALLAAGAPVNAQTKRSENYNVVGANLQYQIGPGQTPLHLAANAGYPGMVELLLAKGADANAEDGKGQTPLSLAVQKPQVMQLLLAAHANPNAGRLNLPLAKAAYNGDMTTLKLLLANGADPNTNSAVDPSIGWNGSSASSGPFTPLYLAVIQKHADAVGELLRFKANPNLGYNKCPLLYYALSDMPSLRAILDSGANPNQTVQGTPLLYYARWDMPSLKALLDGGANPNQTVSGTPLLLQAVIENNQPAVELLLAHQADVNATNKGVNSDGMAPLHTGAAFGYTNIAELLLKSGADVKARDKNGDTPLHLAVRNGRRELAELLLANKADPNERNNAGQTPLDLAKSQVTSGQGQPPARARVDPGTGMPVPMPPAGAAPTLAYQWRTGTAASASAPEPIPGTMVELLRQHGAADDLPRPDCIELRRPAVKYSTVVFTKGTNNRSPFSLFELIAAHYGFLARTPAGESRQAYDMNFAKGLAFPDFSRVRIRQPGADFKSWEEKTIDLTAALKSTNCTADVPLVWGDVIDIPERDHPLDQSWPGFSMADFAALEKCLTRQVEVIIKGQSTNLTLAPSTQFVQYRAMVEPVKKASFWVKPVLRDSGLLLASSDLSQVKVTRRDQASGQEQAWVVDCRETSPAPDFWLRDGDKIEVPERAGSALVEEAAAAPTPSAGLPTASTSFSERLQNIIQRAAPPSAEIASPIPPTAPQALPPPPAQAPDIRPMPAPPGRAPRPPASKAPPALEDEHPTLGGVTYSPKPDDPELLEAGYQKDRSARTRKGESWEERAGSELRGRAGNTAVWTGADLIVFGGEGMGASFDDGARYCFVENTWAALPQAGAPSSRTGHAAVWTGKEMIIWGGFGGSLGNDINHNDGARYNPASNTWKPVSNRNAPAARFDFPAVWTGREMLVWGGYTNSHSRYQGGHADAHLNTGGRYDPSADSWKSITTHGAPSKRYALPMVWTGKEMIVWGGANATKVLNDGGRYNPVRDSWRPISTDGAPSPRASHVAAWTGKEVIVWGGAAREPQTGADYYENGARYNPETDTWRPISTVGAPKGRVIPLAVWSGTEMIVWGGVNDAQASGLNDSGRYVGSGARYSPASDTWTEMTESGAPPPRLTGGAWTGEGLLTFGGYNGTHLNDTWYYSPLRALYPYLKP